MSHKPERQEKNCLNCGTQVAGRYCQNCGQENVITKESFWSLVRHFIYDILHFDGKFFHTIGLLFARPGFVARDYVNGKRAGYLDPIRMYLFTSAVFFILFFAFGNDAGQLKFTPMDEGDRVEMIRELGQKLQQHPGDTAIIRKLALLEDRSNPVFMGQIDSSKLRIGLGNSMEYETLAQYDSVQASLPVSRRDSWITSRLTRKGIDLNEKYKGKYVEGANQFLNHYFHQLPYLLFISLPFFALILKLLYKKNKHFYYSDHAVFTLYHYILSFLFFMIVNSLTALQDNTEWEWISFLGLGFMVTWLVYLYLELKFFYRQGWLKTLLKFILLNFGGALLIILLFLIFFIISLFQF